MGGLREDFLGERTAAPEPEGLCYSGLRCQFFFFNTFSALARMWRASPSEPQIRPLRESPRTGTQGGAVPPRRVVS